MTFPIFCCAHVIYGSLMGFALARRIRSDGEVLGIPLIVTLLPVTLVTVPLGALLLRFSGGWFLHGLWVGEQSVLFEQYHVPLMLLMVLGALASTLVGMVTSSAYLSRDLFQKARLPIVIATTLAILIALICFRSVFWVYGAKSRFLFLHTSGLLSLIIAGVLTATYRLTKRGVR